MSKPMMTQWTAAASGASEVQANVWCAKRMRHPASRRGRNRAGTGWPWAMELVETKAKRPPRGGPPKRGAGGETARP